MDKKRKAIGLILLLPFTLYMWALTIDVFFVDFPVQHLPYSVIVSGATIWLTFFVVNVFLQIKRK